MQIALLYCAVVLSSVLQSSLSKLNGQEKGDPFYFNMEKAGAAFLLFLAASLLTREGFHLPTILFGLLFGVSLTVAMYAGYLALCLGPMGLTSVLVSFSLVIPFLWGVLYRHETLSEFAIAGLCLLPASLILLRLTRKDGSEKRASLRWGFFVLLTAVANGLCSILSADHQSRYPHRYRCLFLAAAMAFTLLFFLSYILIRKNRHSGSRRNLLFGVGAGITNGGYNFFTLWLAGLGPASIVFPILSVATILGASAVGFLVFRERLHPLQWLGFLLGVLSVFFLKR